MPTFTEPEFIVGLPFGKSGYGQVRVRGLTERRIRVFTDYYREGIEDYVGPITVNRVEYDVDLVVSEVASFDDSLSYGYKPVFPTGQLSSGRPALWKIESQGRLQRSGKWNEPATDAARRIIHDSVADFINSFVQSSKGAEFMLRTKAAVIAYEVDATDKAMLKARDMFAEANEAHDKAVERYVNFVNEYNDALVGDYVSPRDELLKKLEPKS